MNRKITIKFYLTIFVMFAIFNFANAQSCIDNTYSYTDDIFSILDAKCTGCHTGGNPQGGWSYSTYALTLAAGNGCGSAVIPGDTAGSSLYQKIKHSLGSGSTNCGAPMPTNGNNLTVDEAQAISKWIFYGAQENCPAEIMGCTNVDACNYDAAANSDDASCILVGDACDDSNPSTENDAIGADCVCAGTLVSIEEYDNFYFSNVYPLPVKEFLNFDYFTNTAGISILSIYNNAGTLVKSLELNTTAGNQTATVNMESNNISNGLYFMTLQLDNKTISKKFIVNN